MNKLPTLPAPGGTARLTQSGVIRAEGPDAASFLQGQLTQDFALLGMSQARLAGFCSAKGRLQASFVAFKRSETEILLVCSQDLLAQTLKRLSMFVLRAKVRLSDASADFQIEGLWGKSVPDALQSMPPWHKLDNDGVHVVSVYPAAGQCRALRVSPRASAPADHSPTDERVWWLSEVLSGVATVTLPVVDLFVPQMLNYESVGGISFKKGCYPGQEIVARSQFRGSIKRRTFIVQSMARLTPGQEIFGDDDSGQPCGVVVQVASPPGFETEGSAACALVCLQVTAVERGQELRAAGPSSPLLWPMTLPYPLREDI